MVEHMLVTSPLSMFQAIYREQTFSSSVLVQFLVSSRERSVLILINNLLSLLYYSLIRTAVPDHIKFIRSYNPNETMAKNRCVVKSAKAG